MESTARIKTAKGNKIKVNDIGEMRIIGWDSLRWMTDSNGLIGYKTREELKKAFPQSENRQFLLAVKKNDDLERQIREAELNLVGTEKMYTTAVGHETPYMKYQKQLKLLLLKMRYYILMAGSKSECEEYQEKVIKKQNRNERMFIRIEAVIIAAAVVVIKEIITNMGWIINKLGGLLEFLLDR